MKNTLISVLIGVNIGIDLPIINDITKGKGFYVTYQLNDNNELEFKEVGCYELAETNSDTNILLAIDATGTFVSKIT